MWFWPTGKPFGINHFDVEPDIVVLAKGITSGYMPLGATACKSFVVEDMPVFMHVHTYNNHPVSTATGLKNLEIISGLTGRELGRGGGRSTGRDCARCPTTPVLGTCGAWG